MRNKNWNWFQNEQNQNSNRSNNEQSSRSRGQRSSRFQNERDTQRGQSNHSQNSESSSNMMSAFLPMMSFNPLSYFLQEMERMMDVTYRNVTQPAMNAGSQALSNMQESVMQSASKLRPNVDIAYNDEEYTVIMEVPGMDERNIQLEVSEDRQLYISGEKRQDSESRDKRFYRMECNWGTFERTLSLPQEADIENIEANYKNGLLTITVPCTESSRRNQIRQIEINAESDQRSERSSNRGKSSSNRERDNNRETNSRENTSRDTSNRDRDENATNASSSTGSTVTHARTKAA